MQRHVTTALLGAVAALALATQASALEKVSFGTNWVAQAEHGGFYQAVADGTYAKCGLDVTIVPGGPQVNNRILLPVGKIDFLMGGNMLQAFSAVEQDIPTIVVAAMFQKEPQVFMTHPGQGLDTWESLKSIKLLIGKGGLNSWYRWMKSEHNFTDEQVRPYTYNSAPFLANKRLAQQGYVTSEPFVIEREGGFKPNIFLIADHGFNTYATTIETRTDMVAKKPEVVKCFVEGSILGWANYIYGDPSKGNAAIQNDNPDMSNEMIAFSINKMKEFGVVDSGESLKLGIGAMTDARHKDFFNKMVKAGVVKSSVAFKKSYTLQFVNSGVGNTLRK
ncbi:MAG: ABC transporter substrate-binding protein [Alphaproteobacteria bacterium]